MTGMEVCYLCCSQKRASGTVAEQSDEYNGRRNRLRMTHLTWDNIPVATMRNKVRWGQLQEERRQVLKVGGWTWWIPGLLSRAKSGERVTNGRV